MTVDIFHVMFHLNASTCPSSFEDIQFHNLQILLAAKETVPKKTVNCVISEKGVTAEFFNKPLMSTPD